MRPPSDMPRPRGRRGERRRLSRRGRIALVVVAALLLLLLMSLRSLAGFYTDFLWFDSLDLTQVWRGVLWAQLSLALIFTAIFFALLFTNLLIADRIAPRFRAPGRDDELLERYHQLVGRRQGLVRVVVSLLFALVAGVGVSGQWEQWLLFRNGGSFGVDDPLFDTDVGFYVFELPFWSYAVSWAFASLIIVFIVTAVAHYLNGGIRLQVSGERVTPQVKAHLSVLLALTAMVKAADYWLQRYELTFSQRGVVDGATYTDVNGQLPATNLLVLISLFAAVLFLINIWRRGWVFPVIAVGLWALVGLVAGAAYPAVMQRFVVSPDESAKEAPFIERNIEATRAALGLDEVVENEFEYSSDLSDEAVVANADTIRNVRLLDPRVVSDTFERLQAEFQFFRFNDLDVDRYELDGETTQVVIASRELNQPGVPQRSWEGQTLTYTHGYGIVLSPANAVTDNGRPDFQIGGVPITNRTDLALDQPQLYFGEGLDRYAIVGTTRAEENGTQQAEPFAADSGVSLDGFVRRAAFALRFWEIEPLISNTITSDSQVLYVRDIRERVQDVAPFLHLDHDPYPVILDGEVKYVVDAYTTTDRYPYAQEADNTDLPEGSGLVGERFNYIRNSVKAVVDAYTGEVTLYLTDGLTGEVDPIAQAWAAAFPDLFTPTDEMPDELRNNLRFPEDMFRVQTAMWSRYHIDQPGAFYNQDDGWLVAQDPGNSVSAARPTQDLTEPTTPVGPNDPVDTGETATTQRIDPYYQLMRLPGDEELEFLAFRPFVPRSANDERKELTAFMVAKSDPESYGQLEVFRMNTRQVDGPAIVDANMKSTPEIAEQLTLLNREGSEVRLGNLLLIPLDDSLLYVRPIYVQAESNPVPELQRVAVALGDRIEIGDTFAEALGDLFPGVDIETDEAPPAEPDDPAAEEEPPAEGEPAPEGEGDADVEQLLAEAEQLFEEADAALAEGDLGAYQEAVEQARATLRRLEQALGLVVPEDEEAGGCGSGGGGEQPAGGAPAGGATTTVPPPGEA